MMKIDDDVFSSQHCGEGGPEDQNDTYILGHSQHICCEDRPVDVTFFDDLYMFLCFFMYVHDVMILMIYMYILYLFYMF